MKIKDILNNIDHKGQFKNIDVLDISCNSKKVVKGTLFVAIKGEKVDGHNFIEEAVKNAKSGQVSYKTDKNGIIHCVIGKVSFDSDALIENLNMLLTDLIKIKPSSAKGIYLKRLSLSTTMGPGLLVDHGSLST